MKKPLYKVIIQYVILPFGIIIGLPFLVLGMYMYGLLPFPREKIKQIYDLDHGGKLILIGTKEQGWGSDGHFWKGKYLPPNSKKTERIKNWLDYSYGEKIEVFLLNDQPVIIQGNQSFQSRNVKGQWHSFKCPNDNCSQEQLSKTIKLLQ